MNEAVHTGLLIVETKTNMKWMRWNKCMMNTVRCLVWVQIPLLTPLQCVKVFRPLDFFHILLPYSLILNCIKSKKVLYQSTHNNKVKTGLDIFDNLYKIRNTLFT
jgi:hypothetical protein